MKILFTAVLSMLFVCISVYSQDLQNADFEEWDDVNGLYEEPSGYWSTNNLLLDIFTASTPSAFVFKEESDVVNGTFAARIVSGVSSGLPIGAYIGVGNFAININDPIKSYQTGTPYTGKPSKLVGYYKYFPVNNDICDIYTYLTKFNPVTGQRDSIAYAGYNTAETVTDYTLLELDFEYYQDVTPDSMFTVFTSSKNAAPPFYVAGNGSTLFVDNFMFDFGTGIYAPIASAYDVNVFPNPSTELLNFEKQDSKQVELIIYSVDGKKIHTETFSNQKLTIDVINFPSGLYHYQIIENKRVLNGGSFEIAH